MIQAEPDRPAGCIIKRTEREPAMMRTQWIMGVCGVLGLLLGASSALGQTTSTGTSTGSGLDTSVTNPPTTTGTGTTTTGTTGTGTVGATSGGAVTPFNNSKNLTSYNNKKTEVQTMQAAGSNTSPTAVTATESVFNSAFLVPFITDIFASLQAFLVQAIANTATGNAIATGTTTSSPA